MYEFCYDYVKPKYDENARLCYMEIDSFIVYIKKMIFIKILQKMLKLDFIFEIMNKIDHCLKEKIQSNWINERWIRREIYDKILLD